MATGNVQVRLSVRGMEEVAESCRRAASALEAMRPSLAAVHADAAVMRSEASVRLFGRTSDPRMLVRAMRWAFVAEWRRAVR